MSGKCEECEFCFPHEEFGAVCADANYGENISGALEEIKDCYSEGFHAFVERTKQEDVLMMLGTKLGQVKIDGRKHIELEDQEGKIIRIKGSKAKETMGELEVERVMAGVVQDIYVVKAIFDDELFAGDRYLIIK